MPKSRINAKICNVSYKDFSIVDLFCGIGGLTHGFIKEGFQVDAGIDLDLSCKFAFQKNNSSTFIHKSITDLSRSQLLSLYDKTKRKILVGCAPCQPFSVYNSKKKKTTRKENDEEKWKLLYSFSKLIEETRPEIVSMENVPFLMKYAKGKVYNDFVKKLQEKKYYVTSYVVNAQDYGVPQRRKRLILFASKHGEIKLIDKSITDKKYITVKDAIGHLPPIEDGVHHPDDALHRARKLSDLNKKRIQATKEGGFWRDWDKSLWLSCHKTKNGKEFHSVYGRMKWNDVAPTMTTYCIGLGNGRFGHPEQDRAISLREAAILQGFPETYELIDPAIPFASQTIARQIGNAVPVGLGVAIAKSIKNHIEQL